MHWMDADHPLLTPTPGILEPPADLQGEELQRWIFEAAVDHMNIHAMVWPARDSAGQLVPPPPEHVLDHLARANDLADEDDINRTSGAGTVAVLTPLPQCDLCEHYEARYDARLETGAGRPVPAFVCPDCYARDGSGSLGASGDVYLMMDSEVPPEVRAICNEIRARSGKKPLFG
jgi:hypothetical protein